MTRNAFYLPALAAIGLGLLALLTGHFHRGLMPVAENLPGKTFLCYTAGLALLFTGAGIFIR
ncbi:MAG TPA: hypothetical protein VL307_16250, partial [Chitinophagaceae bacterium]|nr:hypothetical protein [Chitinophagaceae bacterium]